jgi:hypothetical protein
MPTFDLALLQEAGMSSEFDAIFLLIGWMSAWDVSELGSKLLTIEFLCTLRITESGVYFRLFTCEFYPTWRELSNLLNFPNNIPVDYIEHPILRFFHKWLGFTFFPCDDTSKVRVVDLQLMYATIKKIKVSPVRPLVARWLIAPTYRVGLIVVCSLVTRIASNLDMLQGASL